MSTRDTFPSFISVLVDTAEEEEDGTPSKFNQMRELQMISDLTRADASLKSVKAFRVHNERQYKEKELKELRAKEIREPLEESYTVIEVLQGKLARRDEMIHKLRKYITVDMFRTKEATADESRAKVIEFNQVEEHNQMLLMDSISEFQKAMEHQATKIERHRSIIGVQKDKIKSLTAALETQEFSHKEQIRTIESDKILYLKLLEGKENIIENLNTEKEGHKTKIRHLESSLEETKVKLKDSEAFVQVQKQQLNEAEMEYSQLHQKYATTEYNYLECQDNLVELQEKHTNLRSRYEALVAELDEMVEAGCIIPSPEELQAARKTKRDSVKRGSGGSMKLTKGKSFKKGVNSSLNAGSSMDGGSSFESNSIAEEDPPTPGIRNVSNSITANNTANNTTSSNQIEHTQNNNTPHGLEGEGSSGKEKEKEKDFSNPNANKFLVRMQHEDSAMEQAALEGRIARRGDALSMELTKDITHLKQQLAAQQTEHAEALLKAQMAKQNLESAQQIVNAEMRRVTAKNIELSTANQTLLVELNERVQHIETLEEQTSSLNFQVEALSRKLSPPRNHIACGPETPENSPGLAFDDEMQTQADPKEGEGFQGYGEPQEYDAGFDINDYISAPPVDVCTQFGASEFIEATTQFPYRFDPDWEIHDKTTQTNPGDILYPTEFYLETLFRDYIAESQTHIPPHNLHILQLNRFEESEKEKASRIGGRPEEDPPPMLEEAAVFRVKRGIGYLGALNDLRNKHIRYLNQTGAWNAANARMVIRCIDLVLQTMHNILCPTVMQEDSEYMELRRATDPGEATYYSDDGGEEEEAHTYGQLKNITAKWKKAVKAVIRKNTTFPLTESDLATDHNYGAPKGILGAHEGQTVSKAVTKYMNRSVRSSRKVMTNVDALLDMADGKTPLPPSSPLDRSPTPGHRPPRSANTAPSSSSRASSAASPGHSTVPSMQASPLISAFAAKVAAVAAFAYGSDSSPESSPKHASRKVSTVLPIPEFCGDSVDGTDSQDITALYTVQPTAAQTAAVVQGYYNFGVELHREDFASAAAAVRAQTIGLSAAEVGMGDTVSNLKVKLKDERFVGASFEVNDESDEDDVVILRQSFKARKPSKSVKKASVGNLSATTEGGEFLDYTRLPFNPLSAENGSHHKKLSISGISPSPLNRKSSATSARTHSSSAPRHNSVGNYLAVAVVEEEDIHSKVVSKSSPRETETTPQAQEELGFTPTQHIGDEGGKFTHFPFPDEAFSLQTYMNNMPAGDREGAVNDTESVNQKLLGDVEKNFPSAVTDEEGSGTQSNSHVFSNHSGGLRTDRSPPHTPTFAEQAFHLQMLSPLSQPHPNNIVDSVSTQQIVYSNAPYEGGKKGSTPKHIGLSSGGGLKGLLQRNIDASARAVYELQEQQRQRERAGSHGSDSGNGNGDWSGAPMLTGHGLQTKSPSAHGASATSARPPLQSRPSSTKQSVRSKHHKSKEIDWSGPATIPVVTSPRHHEVLEAVGRPVSAASPGPGPVPAKATPPPSDTNITEATEPRRDSFQLPTSGSVDLSKMFPGPSPRAGATATGAQDEVIILRDTSPAAAESAQHDPQLDMMIAGQRRINVTKKEKVTNAVMFM